MFSFIFDPEVYSKARHQELLEEARQYRLVQEARQSGRNQARGLAKILALTGRWLVSYGTELEKRYGVANSTATVRTQIEASSCC